MDAASVSNSGSGFGPMLLLEQVRRRAPGSDVVLAVGVVALLSILILPLPPIVLDFGLASSVTSSVLVLMVALFLERPLDFTSFPTLLLLTTLLRLSLEVATTRLILSHGHEGPLAAGHVVAAFGGFLMGGDVVIGVILFTILLVVNFMVITKGSGRIAEVAARFSLDAMPGKQMAIDAELSSGAITEKVARVRRRELEEESGFYGAMDGAAKFVRGDAIASLLITVINILGGLAVGLIRHGMALSDAAATFSTLTIGDGLVSQIPALLVSTAAGIVVTKGGVDGRADAALVRQLGGSAKPLALASGAAIMLAAMPGLPAFPFVALGALAGGASWLRFRSPKPVAEEDASTVIPTSTSAPVAEAMRIDLIRLELGYALLPLASGEQPRLPEQIRSLRRSIAADMGLVLPSIRIQDNMQLEPETYVIRIKEVEAARGKIRPDRLLVMDPNGSLPNLAGERTQEPAFGLPALWIDMSLRDEALFKGCTVVDASSVLTTHLTETARENMAELLTYAETQKLLDELPREQQRLVADLIPSVASTAAVQRILQGLLSERVSIRDLPTILEGIQDAAGSGMRGIPTILAHVRTRLARQLSEMHTGPQGYIPLVTLSPEWELAFAESLTGPPDDRQLAMAPSRLSEFVEKLRAALDRAIRAGETPVLLVSQHLRGHVQAIVNRVRPTTPVLAQTEISLRSRIRTLETI